MFVILTTTKMAFPSHNLNILNIYICYCYKHEPFFKETWHTAQCVKEQISIGFSRLYSSRKHGCLRALYKKGINHIEETVNIHQLMVTKVIGAE